MTEKRNHNFSDINSAGKNGLQKSSSLGITKEDILKEFELYQNNLKHKQRRDNNDRSMSKSVKGRTPTKHLTASKARNSFSSSTSKQRRTTNIKFYFKDVMKSIEL
jgi:hypothetical protein